MTTEDNQKSKFLTNVGATHVESFEFV